MAIGYLTKTLKQVSGTGVVIAGPVRLYSVILASVDGATSGVGKCEIRDGVGTTVLATLRVLADTTVVWQLGENGVPFTTDIHATISGAGPGILATFEYGSGG